MNRIPAEQSLLDRVRSLRVETSALLTAVRATMGASAPEPGHPDIPEEWMPQYQRQVQEKLIILEQNGTKNRNC